MEAAPGGSPAPAAEAPAPQPEARTLEPRSDRRAGRLSFCTKVCYGIGGVPNQVASSATAFYLQLFLLDVAQIPAAQASLVLFGGKVSGAAADPVAGFFISRSRRTGSGRLMPWPGFVGDPPPVCPHRVLGCMPFIALAYFFLWYLPPFTNLRGLWYMTFYCLFQALSTLPPPGLWAGCTCCPRPGPRPEGSRGDVPASRGPGWDRRPLGGLGGEGASSKLRAPQFFQVPYTALTMLLTPSPPERDSATAYRMTLEMAGTLLGAAAHGLIVSGAHGPHRCEDAEFPGPGAVSPNATCLYSIAAAVVAVTYPVCSGLLCLGVKERPGTGVQAEAGAGLLRGMGFGLELCQVEMSPSCVADPSAPASSQDMSFLAGLGLTVRHPPYLKLVVSFLFISAAVQVEQSYLVLFCTHASQLHDHVQSLVLTILVSAVLSTPLWEWFLQRFGKRMSALGSVTGPGTGLLVRRVSACWEEQGGQAEGQLVCLSPQVMVPFVILLAAVPTAPVAYVVAFVSGVSIAVSLLLPWSMLPDVVDDFQLQHQHGPGIETIFYSSYVFFTKLSGAGALGISTLSLEFAGYKAGACKQAEQVVVTLKVLIGAVPTCMILTGLCILMVGPGPKVPSQDTSRQLSLRRWAPPAHGYTSRATSTHGGT
ncbi:hypothetical protein QTO34_006791 [Cnephaeus nilssonii]|uniref:Major facilitator superfamily domain-containing protein 2B n=1 Tax=Cnephaeus nilssonii TaxID=3371016 RepID=A0AA40HL65_CNENI|nr:hypothetical protein QTO34_006791 [Eptesicus nilssonii]